MGITRSYVAELETIIRDELLPTYLRHYRLLNMKNPLTSQQRELLKEMDTHTKVCALLQFNNSALESEPKK